MALGLGKEGMQLSISMLFWRDSVYHGVHLVVRGFSPSTFTWVGEWAGCNTQTQVSRLG